MVTTERAIEILNGSFSYEFTNSYLEITPIKENGNLNCKESFTLDLGMLDADTIKKIIDPDNLAEKDDTITLEVEYELNSGYIYDENNETIGEYNFVVKGEWLYNIYLNYYINDYPTFADFLDTYDADEVGEEIYQLAEENNAIVENCGITYYNN